MKGNFCKVKLVSGALILVLWPVFAGDAEIYLRVMGMAFFYGTLALAWNIYALTGSISLGHAAFFGLGAYGSALLSYYSTLPVFTTLLSGGAIAGAYGILWHLALKRLRGAALALATLASVEIPKVIIDNWDAFTFGSLGMVGIKRLPCMRLNGLITADFGENLEAQYYLLMVLLFMVAYLHSRAISSRWGWAVRAVREDETTASALGIDVAGTRFKALILSASLTGICGALYAHLIGLIEPGIVFGVHMSALPLILSIFGGRYQSYGPLLGAVILYPLDQLVFHPLVPVGHGALYGIIIIAAILFFPHGVGSWLQERIRPA